jgi:hypothetical protein
MQMGCVVVPPDILRLTYTKFARRGRLVSYDSAENDKIGQLTIRIVLGIDSVTVPIISILLINQYSVRVSLVGNIT